jgi:hypothetical protein
MTGVVCPKTGGREGIYLVIGVRKLFIRSPGLKNNPSGTADGADRLLINDLSPLK